MNKPKMMDQDRQSTLEDRSAEVRHTETNERGGNVSYWLMGALLLLPLIHAGGLGIGEYIRLGLITAGLAYLWLQNSASGRTGLSLLAFVLIFALIQFDPAQNGEGQSERNFFIRAYLWAYGGLVVAAVLYFAHSASWRIKMDFFDKVAIAIALALVFFSAVSSLLAGKDIVWGTQIKILLAVLIWLLVAHAFAANGAYLKRFQVGALGVFALICLVGLIRALTAFYHYQSGEQAQSGEHLDAALYHYERGAGLSRELGMGYIEETCTFRMAGILAGQGKIEASIEVLALEEDFVRVVRAEDWEGPEGGNLFYPTKCWKHLMLYKGKVEFKIYASGTPALKEWPLMRVKLGDDILGDVFVNSGDLQPYSFPVEIHEKGRRRLEISFLNDFHQAKPYIDRNLLVERAEIQYHSINWR